jgi:hypothetical protein
VVDHHRLIRQQRKQQQILLQQELAYVKQLKYTNKLSSEPGSFNVAGQQNSYQNLNYNIDYQNLDKMKSTSVCQKTYILGGSGQQHLKHIENVVYKQSNNLSETNIGWENKLTFLYRFKRFHAHFKLAFNFLKIIANFFPVVRRKFHIA